MTARSRAACARFGEIQLFTLVNRGVPRPFDTLDAVPEAPEIEERSLCAGKQNPRDWWVVTITAIEVIRIQAAQLAPLTQAQIKADPRGQRHSLLRARIGWGSAGNGHEIDIDIGSGVRIGIETCDVDVRVVTPRLRAKEIAKGSDIVLGDGSGGLYADSLITAHATPSHGPPSARCPTLTQVLSIPPNASRSVAIPPFARWVTTSRYLADAFGPFSFTVGLNGPSVRDFTFMPNDPGATVRVIIPQVATHINFGPPSEEARTVTLVWELDI